MAIRGVSITITYTAWDTSANGPKTGDVANHTLRWIKDGTAAAPTNSPAEVDATNAKGEYSLTLTAAEMTCDAGTLCGKSSTANIVLIPVKITTEHGVLPTVQQGNAGAVLTSGTGTAQVAVSGGAVTTVTTVTNQLTAAAIATGVWQDTTSGDFTTSGSIGKSLFTSGNAPGAASGLALVGSNVGTATSVSGSVGSVTGSVGSVTGAVGSVTGNVGGNVAGSVGSVATGGITLGSFSNTAWLGLGPNYLAFTGTGTLNAVNMIDDYCYAQLYNDRPAFQAVSVGTFYYWYSSGDSAWILSTVLGTKGTNYFQSATARPDSTLTGHGTTTGPPTVTLGLRYVDLNTILGTLSAGAAGYVGIDWGHVNAPTSTVGLSGTTIGTLTTYTGNTPQTGDAYAIVSNGTYGNSALHTQVGTLQTTANTINVTTSTNLDTNVGSRMATYTQPTGFLAATFPGTVASTTNITAGTITTVTNLTNAPTSGDFTAAMKTSLDAATPASVVGAVGSVTAGVTVSTNNDKTGYSLTIAPLDAAGTRAAVGLAAANLDTQLAALGADILTRASATVAPSWAGTAQSGDAYAVVSNGSYGNAAIKSDTSTLLARITSTLFSGITSLGKWLGLITGNAADASTLAELNATPAAATYDNTTNSLEAGTTISSATADKIADHVLRRHMANVETSSDGDAMALASLYGAVQQMQESDTTTTPDKLTVFKTNGTTQLGQKNLTSDSSAAPVTGVK